MTARETIIAKKILDNLHGLDGGQAHVLTIHGDIGGLNVCSGAEFESVLNLLDQRNFIIGVQTKFRGVMWNISDAGEAARLEMK